MTTFRLALSLLPWAFVLLQCRQFPEIQTALLSLAPLVIPLALLALKILGPALPPHEDSRDERLRWGLRILYVHLVLLVSTPWWQPVLSVLAIWGIFYRDRVGRWCPALLSASLRLLGVVPVLWLLHDWAGPSEWALLFVSVLVLPIEILARRHPLARDTVRYVQGGLVAARTWVLVPDIRVLVFLSGLLLLLDRRVLGVAAAEPQEGREPWPLMPGTQCCPTCKESPPPRQWREERQFATTGERAVAVYFPYPVASPDWARQIEQEQGIDMQDFWLALSGLPRLVWEDPRHYVTVHRNLRLPELEASDALDSIRPTPASLYAESELAEARNSLPVLHTLVWSVVLVLRTRFLGGEHGAWLATLAGVTGALCSLAHVGLCARARRRCDDCGFPLENCW